MRCYYALGALLLGIVLLYLYTNNNEPFTTKKSIYLYRPAGNSVPATIKNNAGLNVIIDNKNPTKIIILYGSKTYTLNDYDIFVYSRGGKNCENKKDTNGNCWDKVTNVLTLSNYQENPKLLPTVIGTKTNNGILTRKQKPEKGLTITNFSASNLGLFETNNAKLQSNNGANIRIDLMLQ